MWQSFIFILMGILFFTDFFIRFLMPTLITPINLYFPAEIRQVIEDKIEPLYRYSDIVSAEIIVSIHHESYQVEFVKPFKGNHRYHIHHFIEHYHQMTLLNHMTAIEADKVLDIMYPTIVWHDEDQAKDGEYGFMIITSIYFLMLSFSTTVANEVVVEKTSNTCEMMLTSISYKEHYYAKMLIGWFAIIIQAISLLAIIGFWFVLRLIIDKGEGLFALFYQWQWIPIPGVNFITLLANISIKSEQIITWLLLLFFLFSGILLVQLIVLLCSVHIESIEEASSIQGPFYLGLLVLYYVVLLLNNPSFMQSILGLIVSSLPLFSMLFMPVRLLFYAVTVAEWFLAGIVSVVVLGLAIIYGEAYYKRHLLRGNSAAYVKNKE